MTIPEAIPKVGRSENLSAFTLAHFLYLVAVVVVVAIIIIIIVVVVNIILGHVLQR